MTTSEEWWTVADCAAYVGVDPMTWRGYVSRGTAPAPDDPDDDRVPQRRTPRWRPGTVQAWQETRMRPGVGGRRSAKD